MMLSPCSQGPAGCRVAEQHWNVPAPKLADTNDNIIIIITSYYDDYCNDVTGLLSLLHSVTWRMLSPNSTTRSFVDVGSISTRTRKARAVPAAGLN